MCISRLRIDHSTLFCTFYLKTSVTTLLCCINLKARTMIPYRCQAQVAALQQERDNLLNSQRNTTDVDAQKNLHLQRQKTQLEQRVW